MVYRRKVSFGIAKVLQTWLSTVTFQIQHNLDFIAIMETGKQDMSKTSLNRLSGGSDFIWHCLLPKGGSGGILLGVNATVLEVSMIVEGEFYIKFHLYNKSNHFQWILMAVYNPTQDNFKTAFLSELV
jgi:hypothetical protein